MRNTSKNSPTQPFNTDFGKTSFKRFTFNLLNVYIKSISRNYLCCNSLLLRLLVIEYSINQWTLMMNSIYLFLRSLHKAFFSSLSKAPSVSIYAIERYLSLSVINISRTLWYTWRSLLCTPTLYKTLNNNGWIELKPENVNIHVLCSNLEPNWPLKTALNHRCIRFVRQL